MTRLLDEKFLRRKIARNSEVSLEIAEKLRETADKIEREVQSRKDRDTEFLVAGETLETLKVMNRALRTDILVYNFTEIVQVAIIDLDDDND